MSKEAMKLALEALEVLGWQPTEEAMDYRDNAITALREALAEQALDKMAENARELGLDYDVKSDHRLMDMPAQRTWVSLTDEERDYIWHTVGNSDAHGDVDGWSGRDVMAAIEAKLKEKNSG